MTSLDREQELAAGVETEVRAAVEALEFDALKREFDDNNQLAFVPRFLPDRLVHSMIDEARSLLPHVHRTRLPFIRKAGTVGQDRIGASAPILHAVHRSAALLDLASRLSGIELSFKSERDAHAAALYCYERAGDHVGFHYDHCGCEETASYTATVGLVHETTARVEFQLFKDDPERPMRQLFVAMEPGSLVLFCGSRAYHRVTPLRENERRIVYSFAYVREGKKLTGVPRLVENFKDAILYFGPKAIFQRNYR